ncbi:MAG: hypothetical protein DHS20C15_24240 [Planctomycetota bacterium]|nr:MAG: hypothetical protein DHS20C15_24240 [Planctomycetota bacterium]
MNKSDGNEPDHHEDCGEQGRSSALFEADTAPDVSRGIRQLLDGEIAAVRIPGFLSSKEVGLIVRRIDRATERNQHGLVAGLESLGISYFEAATSDAALRRYFRQARATNSASDEMLPVRRFIHDLVRVRGEMVGVAVDDGGRELAGGIVRILGESHDIRPHCDSVGEEVPTGVWAPDIDSQLGVNVFIETPEAGGALHVWDAVDADEASKRRGRASSRNYGIDTIDLGKPTVTITPRPGDLIALNTEHIHSVEPGNRGRRSTVSWFVGRDRTSGRLLIWA